MKLDAEAARRGIKDKIAGPLKLDVIVAAQAIVDIAVNKMSLAVREVSVAKGYDPRDFALVASGGAGPLHVCAIARELYIPTVIVPLFPSHFSALGMLLADERHDFTRTVYADLASVDFGKLVAVHDEMVKDAAGSLRHIKNAAYQIHLDLRYMGQEFTLQVPVTLDQLKRGERKAIRTAFDDLYEQRYAHHSPEEPVEMVNIRLGAIGKRPKLAFPSLAASAAGTPSGERAAYFTSAEKPLTAKVYKREALGAGAEVSGPALVQEHGTTTVLFENDRGKVADSGELIVTIGAAG
jgi:N-methylhydantoinase A